MEIVINIPDKLYNFAKNGHFFDAYDMYDVSMCIAKGTPLPKGHGKLIDADALKQRYVARNSDSPFDKSWITTVRRTINEAPTIIEADKESK